MSSPPPLQSPSRSLDQSPDETIQIHELKHVLHKHLLTYDHGRNDGSRRRCAVCMKNIPGGDDDDAAAYAYNCKGCNFYHHKLCADLPRYIRNSLHPMHILELLSFSISKYCSLCDKRMLRGGYKCTSCDFTLHMRPCASETTFDPNNHNHDHSFRSLKPTLFTCDACGIDEQDTKCVSSVCSVCQLQIHTKCRKRFPLTVRQRMHSHKLKLCYSFEIDFDYAKKLCKICQRNMNNVLCLYQCVDGCTSYIAHAICATSTDLLVEDFVPGHDNISKDVERKELDPKQELQVITHFSHPDHSLVLSNDEPGYDVAVCDGCVRPISAPFYACDSEQCEFFLHERCSVLPGTIQSPLHQHQLKLKDFSNMAYINMDNIFHGFTCQACHVRCNGFGYECKECDYTYDVGCALFEETLKHPSHKCTLALVSMSPNGENKCIACDSSFSTAYWCEECNFFLDLKCASLPKTIGHDCPTGTVWSIKPIKLWYDCIEHAGGQYYCDLCGETRGKDLWFYYCEDCRDSIHPQCLLGRDDRFLYGKFYKINGHCHTVCVAKKPKTTDPLCDTCGKPCHDPTLLFCPTCNIYFHPNRRCCGMSSLSWDGPIKNYCCGNTSSNPHANEDVDGDKNDDEETTIGQVNHFCHPHSLIIGEYDREILCEEVCDGCGMPISAPFYTCPVKKGRCNFFLHKECYELPKQIQHPLHPQHPLVLNSFLDMPWDDGQQVGFICYGCDALCNGFVYACQECKFFLEVGCSLLLDTLVHETHQYCTLTLVDKINVRQQENGGRKCSACNSVSCSWRYRCDECNFELDLHCVSLPKMVMHECRKHGWDTRPRHLSYGDTKEEEDDDEEDKSVFENHCDECFGRVRGNEWYYYCEDCHQYAHHRCTFTRSSLLKNGIVYRAYNHFHYLVTVRADGKIFELCVVCHEKLGDHNILYCAECDYYLHVKCCRELRRA